MMFICTKQMLVDGSMIYHGTYDSKIERQEYIVVGAQGINHNINLISNKNELLKCGYFIDEEKGWTITFYSWDDDEGKPRVAGRFKTTKEKDKFLEKISQPNSGWTLEELSIISVINDYCHMLPV